jgi:hypothetical protein
MMASRVGPPRASAHRGWFLRARDRLNALYLNNRDALAECPWGRLN